jgi:hypothetical protein
VLSVGASFRREDRFWPVPIHSQGVPPCSRQDYPIVRWIQVRLPVCCRG